MARIEYDIKAGSVTQLLNLTFEIYAISGMTPDKIVYEDEEICWDASDVRRLRGGDISERDYLDKHQKPF